SRRFHSLHAARPAGGTAERARVSERGRGASRTRCRRAGTRERVPLRVPPAGRAESTGLTVRASAVVRLLVDPMEAAAHEQGLCRVDAAQRDGDRVRADRALQTNTVAVDQRIGEPARRAVALEVRQRQLLLGGDIYEAKTLEQAVFPPNVKAPVA